MSYKFRKVELLSCNGTMTVHCETANGEMRCELCGNIKELNKSNKDKVLATYYDDDDFGEGYDSWDDMY
jgi:hypothetical protein